MAEAIAQTQQLHTGTLDEYITGAATRQARQEIGGERLRLLYVGITRARREVILTYNTGHQPDRKPNGPALAFEALLGRTKAWSGVSRSKARPFTPSHAHLFTLPNPAFCRPVL